MKEELAKEYIEDCKNEDGTFDEKQLIEVLQWAYDHGFVKGYEECREDREDW